MDIMLVAIVPTLGGKMEAAMMSIGTSIAPHVGPRPTMTVRVVRNATIARSVVGTESGPSRFPLLTATPTR